jgi:hypothetical protein
VFSRDAAKADLGDSSDQKKAEAAAKKAAKKTASKEGA